MTFTYTLSPVSDLTRVRFHTADTVEPAMFTDEEINFVLAEKAGESVPWQATVIALLVNIIQKMSLTPDFGADWLSVNAADARKNLQQLLNQKRREFGIPAITATVVHRYRADSRADSVPDFDDMVDPVES